MRGHTSRVSLLVMIGLALLLVLPAAAAPAIRQASAPAVLHSGVQQWLIKASSGERTSVLVIFKDDGSQLQADEGRAITDRQSRRSHVDQVLGQRASRNGAAVRMFLRQSGLEGEVAGLQVYKSFNGISLSASKRAIEALQRWERISLIEPDASIQLEQPAQAQTLDQINAVEWNITKIGADRVWSELGINGSGVVVGGLDTGVRHTHQNLRDNYKCAGMTNHSACWKDPLGGRTVPYDDGNHGTHTMGTAVGNGGIGVAPGARWIACKAFSGAGSGSSSAIAQCFDFFLAPGGNPANAPDVVINSWGGGGTSTAHQQAVNNMVNAGIFPEFSNGNAGPNCGTVNSPASYANAFGTGATDSNDLIAGFSSRGPSPFGSMKPEVSAPGVSIRSAIGTGDASYSSMSGTSMAGPHTAGLVALLVDANPTLSIAQLGSIMRLNALGIAATGCSSSGIPNNIYGYGRIRAYESVRAALGDVNPTPTRSATRTSTSVGPTITRTRTNTPGGPTATATRTRTSTTGGTINRALNKPATGSASCNTSETPPKAVDGTTANNSKFCSLASSKWLRVDLGASYSITRFVLKHAGAGGETTSWNTRAFNIQTSVDGVTWSTVVTVSANTASTSSHSIVATSARYVRLNVTQGEQTGYTARIYELEVY